MNFLNIQPGKLGLLLLLALSFFSCKKEKLDDITLDIFDKELLIQDFTVNGADEVIINESNKTVTLKYPCGTDVKSITPNISISSGASITPASGTSVDLSSPVQYTITNGNLFSTYTVSADVLCIVGFLSHHSSPAAITDDDESAAAEWLFNTFDKEVTRFVSFDDIKADPTVLDDIKVLWWLLDGDPVTLAFWTPPMAVDPDVLGAITDWFKAGGNMYLYQYGCQMIFLTGRMPTNTILGPAIGGGGPGFDNPDTWGIGVVPGAIHDMSSHPVFAGIQFEDNGSQKWIPVSSPGWKEDRNYMMDKLPDYYGEPFDQPVERIYEEFTSEFDVVWLGSWDWQNDYRVAGMLEFLPSGEYQGRVIYNGVGGAEFNQNATGENGAESEINPDGINAYQGNLETMAKNSINYLIKN
ncbi:MAG: DUF4960 domain-containing protein [Phaeodactylibacter sp.]|nr:DUF4960 domain-containing protein [Phaeodactylibacter sp.]